MPNNKLKHSDFFLLTVSFFQYTKKSQLSLNVLSNVLYLTNTTIILPNFKISTIVPLSLANMAAHVSILLEVTSVIALLDILATTVKQVKSGIYIKS